MKFTFDRDHMIQAIGYVQKAVNPKSPKIILSGICIHVENKNAVLNCTDNEIGIECTIGAEVFEEGKIVVNAQLFGDIVRNMPNLDITLMTLDDVKIKLTSGDSVFELFYLKADGFPPFSEIEREGEYKIDQLVLKKMLQQTAFAISVDDTRKILTGLLLESNQNELVAVAVDGFRVALRRNTMDGENTDIYVIIPGKTVSELIKIIPSNSGALSLYGNKNQAIIEFDNCRVSTRIIDGQFFNYKYIVPEEYVTRLTINRGLLLDSVERASLILNAEQSKRFPVVFSIREDSFVVKAVSDLGNVEEDIKIEMTGEELEVAFNPKYFIEALKAIEDDSIVITFTNKVGQCVIKPIHNDSYIYLILPVRIG